jgi:hypothetical protein
LNCSCSSVYIILKVRIHVGRRERQMSAMTSQAHIEKT